LMLGLHPSLRRIPAYVISKDFNLTDCQKVKCEKKTAEASLQPVF